MRLILTLLGVGALICLPGCAGVDYKPYPKSDSKEVGGIVYYDDSPYLIVWPDGKGNVQWQLQFLPDQTKKRIASPYNYISTLSSSLSFTNGVLNQSSVTVDNTAMLKSLATAAASIASAAFDAAVASGKAPPHTATVWIFKMTVHHDKGGGYAQFKNASQTIIVPLQMFSSELGAESEKNAHIEIDATQHAPKDVP